MRKVIARVLRWQAQRYLAKQPPKVIVVAGSVGKTSTTQAIATVLATQFSVRKTISNYNTDLGVPCSIFGRNFPGHVKNPFGWAWLIVRNQFTLFSKPDFSVLVLELGTDAVGEIESFSWLAPDIAVITAIAPEHMQQFTTIEAVAKEELSVSAYSDKTFINKRAVGKEYLHFAFSEDLFNYDRSDVDELINATELQVVGGHSRDALAAAVVVGRELGLSESNLQSGLKNVTPVNGRMRKLSGIKDSVLIDDTYNSSPEAVLAALDYLYETDAPQRIVLLGNMNELGDVSAEEHSKIGKYCDPKKLDLVVTLGPEANKYTAPAATDAGCLVAPTETPYQAAEIIKKQLKPGALVLLKGSQNAVFAEEATKLLLQNPADEKHLVRQSHFWARKKKANFGDIG